MGIIAGYFVMRYAARKAQHGRGHPQSLLIAGLSAGWVLFDLAVVGLPRPLELAFALTGALFATLFLLAIVDDLRRHGLRLQEKDEPKE